MALLMPASAKICKNDIKDDTNATKPKSVGDSNRASIEICTICKIALQIEDNVVQRTAEKV